MQRAFWVGTNDDPAHTIATELPDHLMTRGAIFIGVSIVLLVVAQLIFSRLEKRIPERL